MKERRDKELENNNYQLINMNDVEAEKVEWLWEGFIPVGKLTILHGDPGKGKTMAMLNIIAALTTGRELFDPPGSTPVREPVNVIYQTAEDGLADTVKPRLMEAGADCSRVYVIDDSERALNMSDERLEMAIADTGAKLVVLDPLQAFLGAKVDMHRANEVRPQMKHLSDMAARHKCAMVLIGHLNKMANASADYRGLGSMDFMAAARSVILCAKSKDDPEVRVLAPTKSSMTYEHNPVAFRLSKEGGFEWEGECDVTVDELLSNAMKKGYKRDEAMEFVRDQLSEQMLPSTELYGRAERAGISKKTLRNAMKDIGVESIKDGDRWYVGLPTWN